MHIILRPVTIKDAKILYQLLKERPAYANISHNRMPKMDEHIAFIESLPYYKWYVIETSYLGSAKDIGSIYLTLKDEIGVSILRKYWRKGYARATIKEMIHKYPRDKYYANISPVNVASQRLFKRLGFNMLQYTLVRQIDE